MGVERYEHIGPNLPGCVRDANRIRDLLARNADAEETKNFDVLVQKARDGRTAEGVRKADLKENIKTLFAGQHEVALFYYSGHGNVEATGGYLLTTDSSAGDDGLAFQDILTIAKDSKARQKVIILDCCYSGEAGKAPGEDLVQLRQGMTILTASTDKQTASMLAKGEGSVFTDLLADALGGSAANLLGDVTLGSVYAHIDQSLGAFDQRPVFKTWVQEFVSLRKVRPPIESSELRQIVELFPKPTFVFPLDPSFEERDEGRTRQMPRPDAENVKNFKVLQTYNRVNLLVPKDAPHMWHAAMESKSCQLTTLGRHYWRLVKENRI
ncbi:MAG TPA: caspase family protein [Polyangiaceae bacterium]|nr:caspase family protein [Polyangiaceae bacterium]